MRLSLGAVVCRVIPSQRSSQMRLITIIWPWRHPYAPRSTTLTDPNNLLLSATPLQDILCGRQQAGIEKAKAAGKYKGRPSSIDTNRLMTLKSQGLGATAIAKELGVTRSAVYKAFDRI